MNSLQLIRKAQKVKRHYTRYTKPETPLADLCLKGKRILSLPPHPAIMHDLTHPVVYLSDLQRDELREILKVRRIHRIYPPTK
jgi:hypothetical protein